MFLMLLCLLLQNLCNLFSSLQHESCNRISFCRIVHSPVSNVPPKKFVIAEHVYMFNQAMIGAFPLFSALAFLDFPPFFCRVVYTQKHTNMPVNLLCWYYFCVWDGDACTWDKGLLLFHLSGFLKKQNCFFQSF